MKSHHRIPLIRPTRPGGRRTHWRRVLVEVGPVAVLMMTVAAASALAMRSTAAQARPAPETSAARGYDAEQGELPPGPWGRIHWRRMTISPPDEAVRELIADAPAPRWHFPRMPRRQLADLLAALPVSDDVFARLLECTTARPGGDGFTMTPDETLLRDLPAEARKLLYEQLGRHPQNRRQINALRCWTDTPKHWLASSSLDPSMQRIIEPYVYRNGHFLFLADYGSAMARIRDPKARFALVHRLASENTLRLELIVAPGQNVDPLVQYWGAGGRTEVVRRRLLAAAARPGGERVPIGQLLPPFAHQRLYRYPHETGRLTRGASRDCHWSAMNFFNTTPDDRHAIAQHVEHQLVTAYVPVTVPRLGDLVVFENEDHIYHTAVHVAADVVFTKNGGKRTRPWMLLPLEVMKDFYPQADPIRVTYLRRRLVPRQDERGGLSIASGRSPARHH